MVSVISKSRARAKRSVPPSRVKYEAANPAVTVRISRELRDELLELKERAGWSMGDVLRIGLEKAHPAVDEAYMNACIHVLGDCLGIVEGCPNCYERVCGLIPDNL